MQYSLPKGTYDILPDYCLKDDPWKASERWFFLEETIRTLCLNYGYKEIRTPLFERTELFIRGVGESSDIVSKEMYNFEDKGGRPMTLRPEGTASTLRAFAENHLEHFSSSHKFFYIGPFFRYDRPQAGRYRQFHQFGIEAIGQACPEQDLEVIDMLFELYRRLGIKNLKVLLNSVGNSSVREIYKQKLKTFLNPHIENLSEDSKRRFEQNPLRILDSKDPEDRMLLKNAPSVLDDLDEESKNHFEELKSLLNRFHIPFIITPSLVRGLDYYSKTVFEITSDVLGAQNTIGGGGRYDGLLKTLGGADFPAIGFATGMERILQTMLGQHLPFPEIPHPFLYFIPLGEESKNYSLTLLYNLRHQKIPCEIYLRGKKLQKALQDAEHLKASYVLILGEEELKSKSIQLKEMATHKTIPLKLETLSEEIERLWKEYQE